MIKNIFISLFLIFFIQNLYSKSLKIIGLNKLNLNDIQSLTQSDIKSRGDVRRGRTTSGAGGGRFGPNSWQQKSWPQTVASCKPSPPAKLQPKSAAATNSSRVQGPPRGPSSWPNVAACRHGR